MARNLRLLVVLVALLAGLVAADRQTESPAAGPFEEMAFDMPVAAPPGAISSTWYCAAGVVRHGFGAGGEVVIANPGATTVTARITVRAKRGASASVDLEVPPHGRAAHGVRKVLSADLAAVRVDIRGGNAVVEHTLSGDRGRSTGPCTRQTSPEWHMAGGITSRDAREVVVLYNPFPDPAIVDFAFSTSEGRAEPAALTGFVVPGRGVEMVDVGQHVRRRDHVATTIVARTGRLVVDRVQSFDGSAGRAGLALSLAVPAAGVEWWFPDGQVGPGVRELYHFYNPGEEEVAVDLELVLDEGDAEPFQLAVPPQQLLVLDVGADGRVPPGVAHSAIVRTLDGRPIVAERMIIAGGESNRRGVSLMVGARRQARVWAFADGRATDNTDEWIVLLNPGSAAVRFSVGALVGGQVLPIADLQDLELAGGSRRALRIGEHIGRAELALLVEASGSVVVERDLYAVGATGMSAVAGIPIP